MMKYILASAAFAAILVGANAIAGDKKAADAAAPDALSAILETLPDEEKARFDYRHPKETLEFFGVTPGTTVVDVLSGDVWYAGILVDYLGEDGKVVAVDYDVDMWPLFGGFADAEFLEARKTWAETRVAKLEELRDDGDAGVGAFALGEAPEELTGKVDTVLMIRAFHHLNRFEDEGGYSTAALGELNKLLKPGGIVGIVQHRAPEENDDAWADGSNGYVKQSVVVAAMEKAGFELVEASEINANPKDKPTTEDIVWRLPPSLGTSRDDEAKREAMLAIGESDRMTLKFRKPKG